ncbi:MAG: tyrosine-type recombinase/integrase [bacterium]
MKFEQDTTYPGEAYWYSGKDSISAFESKIKNTSYIPGGYKDATNATNRAGIDCSGFVGRIWGVEAADLYYFGTSKIQDQSRLIRKHELQTLDVLNSPDNHVVLFDQWADTEKNYMWIYHAKGSGDPNRGVDDSRRGNMVIQEKVPWSKYSESMGFLPRRRELLAPTSCSMVNNATDVPLRPTITVQLNGPAHPESINSTSIILKQYSGGSAIDGTLTYDEESWLISFTPSNNLEKNTKYIFKLKPEVLDLEGRALDTDLDGKAGGQNLEKVFTTKNSSGILELINLVWGVISGTGSSGLSTMGVEASGTGDNIIDPGETIQLTLTLNNVSSQSVTSISGTLSTIADIDITSATQSFGTISRGTSTSNSDKFIFHVPSSYVADKIDFKLEVTGWIGSDMYVDEYVFSLPVGSLALAPPGASWDEIPTDYGIFAAYSIDDNNRGKTVLGNGNGSFDEGDYIIDLIFYAGNSLANEINATFTLIEATRIGDAAKISINNPRQNLVIPPYSYIEIPFNIMPTCSPGNSIALVVKMESAGGTRQMPLTIRYAAAPQQNIKIESVGPSDVFSPNNDNYKDEVVVHFKPLVKIQKFMGKWGMALFVRKMNEDGTWGGWQEASFKLDDGFSSYGNSINAGTEGVLHWRNEEGLASGLYEFKIGIGSEVSDGYTHWWEEYYSATKSIYLHKTAPQAENLDNTGKFSAMNAALPGSAHLLYDLTLAADTTVEVKNAAGEVVYILANEKLSPSGEKDFVFQCYDEEGEILPDGEYTFNIQLDDRANTAESYVKEFTIDHAPYDFYLITPTSEVISPTKGFVLSWTSASPYGPEWNHLKRYQVWGRRLGTEGEENFELLKGQILPELTSTTMNFVMDGLWEIKMRAIDEEGNWQESDGANSAGFVGDPERILRVNVDSTPPNVFTLSHPWQDGQKFDADKVKSMKIRKGKNRKDRMVPLNNAVIQSLKAYLKIRPRSGLHCLFVTEDGQRPLGGTRAGGVVRRLGIMSGIKRKITPRVLRSTFASLLFDKGVSIKIIQELLGHSDIDTTSKYIRVSVGLLRREMMKHPLLDLSL